MPILAALYFSAAPAGAAYVLGPKACNDPYRSGQSLYLSQRSYLHRDAQLAKLARQRFGIDESAALGTLRERYPGLGLETLRTRVIDCTVYFETSGRGQSRLFDAETFRPVRTKEQP